MSKNDYHVPVMLNECIEALDIDPNGVYVDATYGGGGHATEILRRLDRGRLIAFDQDEDALKQVKPNKRLTVVPANYRYIDEWLSYLGIGKVDGVLADLGVSSYQINEYERGFSFHSNLVDMRMNVKSENQLFDMLSSLDEEQVQDILSEYGEVRNAKTLAKGLVLIQRTEGLDDVSFRKCVEAHVMGNRNRYLAQVYQAFRIFVNDEIGALEDFLNACNDIIEPKGRLVVLSYHSLEDRRVKNLIKRSNAQGLDLVDDKGRREKKWKEVVKGVVLPQEEEIKLNPRSRSAKLRIAEHR